MSSHLKCLSPLILSLGFLASLQGQGFDTGRPDGHAPIGVMGDHTHEQGEVMLSYRYMRMGRAGSRNGTDGLSVAEIVAPTGHNFRVTPTAMPMKMRMIGAMYAPTEELTLMAMLPVVDTQMDHVTRSGGGFRPESRAVGDVSVNALYKLGDFDAQRTHLSFGVRLPSGSIEKEDVTPASAPADSPFTAAIPQDTPTRRPKAAATSMPAAMPTPIECTVLVVIDALPAGRFMKRPLDASVRQRTIVYGSVSSNAHISRRYVTT